MKPKSSTVLSDRKKLQIALRALRDILGEQVLGGSPLKPLRHLENALSQSLRNIAKDALKRIE